MLETIRLWWFPDYMRTLLSEVQVPEVVRRRLGCVRRSGQAARLS